MKQSLAVTFILLVFTAIANVILAFIYGNEGYEAFLAVCFGLLIIFIWQSYGIIAAFIRKYGKFSILLSLPVVVLLWVLVLPAIMGTITYDTPGAVNHDINWMLVVLGIIPFGVQTLFSKRKNTSLTSVAVGMTVTIYSVFVVFIGAILFYDTSSSFSNIGLVIAFEFQLIMNFLIIRAGYFDRALTYANAQLAKHPHLPESVQRYYIVAVCGAPLVIPLVIIIGLMLAAMAAR
ncbi:MAG: hypothetical protein EON51_19245 [Acinetobacter sp.]|nr:MAG: hypothetical protein EON51_19245 [Acinetobacter sp.]